MLSLPTPFLRVIAIFAPVFTSELLNEKGYICFVDVFMKLGYLSSSIMRTGGLGGCHLLNGS
jgi:hypothetical protein